MARGFLALARESVRIMAGESLLVVDENLVNAKLLGVLLESAGYRVQVATDSERALEAIRKTPPRLILMDIKVPHQGGVALVKKIKADPQNSMVRVLMITACIQTGEEKEVLEAGCVGHLSKPIDTRELPKIVAGYLAEV